MSPRMARSGRPRARSASASMNRSKARGASPREAATRARRSSSPWASLLMRTSSRGRVGAWGPERAVEGNRGSYRGNSLAHASIGEGNTNPPPIRQTRGGLMTSAATALQENPRSGNIPHVQRSGIVRTNGQELFYEIHGEGPPLVMLMGIGYDSTLWTLQQVPVLLTRFSVVLLDNRDAGRSSRADHQYTIADMADDVAGVLDALDIHHTHLLGLSMGSMIGMEFALRHPDRLDRLILAGPDAAPARSAVDPIAIWNWVKTNDPSGEVFGGQQLTWLFSSTFLPNQQAVKETIALLASNPNPVQPDAYDRQAQAYLQFDALDRLEAIKVPTLVVVGEQDLLTPPWVAREVAAGIPGARFEIITGNGSSHVVPLERPDDFNQLVTNFLTE